MVKNAILGDISMKTLNYLITTENCHPRRVEHALMNFYAVLFLKRSPMDKLSMIFTSPQPRQLKRHLSNLKIKKHTKFPQNDWFDEEFNQIWQRVESAKINNTLDEDDKKLSDINLQKRYKNIATRRVKLAIIMQKIAEKDSIALTNEELTNGLLEYASRYPGQEKQIFEFFRKNPTQIETIRAPIFENKVLNNIFSNTMKEKQDITIDKLKKLQEKTFSYKN